MGEGSGYRVSRSYGEGGEVQARDLVVVFAFFFLQFVYCSDVNGSARLDFAVNRGVFDLMGFLSTNSISLWACLCLS